jgi:intracellular septation protein
VQESGVSPGGAGSPLRAVQALISDLLATLVFAAVLSVTKNAAVAAGLAIAIGLGRIVYLKARTMPVSGLQWLSLFLVVLFGGATLLMRNPVFVMFKPTLVYTGVGVVMLKSGWMSRYVPLIAQLHGADVTIAFGYLWATLMFATAAANFAVVHWARPAVWALFIATVPITSKLILMATQYVVTRRVVRRRIRAAKAAAAS